MRTLESSDSLKKLNKENFVNFNFSLPFFLSIEFSGRTLG